LDAGQDEVVVINVSLPPLSKSRREKCVENIHFGPGKDIQRDACPTSELNCGAAIVKKSQRYQVFLRSSVEKTYNSNSSRSLIAYGRMVVIMNGLIIIIIIIVVRGSSIQSALLELRNKQK
jgi:hypothetical protein